MTTERTLSADRFGLFSSDPFSYLEQFQGRVTARSLIPWMDVVDAVGDHWAAGPLHT